MKVLEQQSSATACLDNDRAQPLPLAACWLIWGGLAALLWLALLAPFLG